MKMKQLSMTARVILILFPIVIFTRYNSYMIVSSTCPEDKVSRICNMCDWCRQILWASLFNEFFSSSMAGFSQDGSGSETQQWSQNSPWTSWSQVQYRLHRPSLGSRNFNNFQLFADEDVELIGTQMPQNVEGSIDVSIREQIEDTT